MAEILKCQECGEEFGNRSDLGKHLYQHRKEREKQEELEGPIVIPVDRLFELSLTSEGGYARIYCDGIRRGDKFIIHEIQFVK